MWYGAATLSGLIVGVGIFGLPYAAARAGFFVQLGYLCVFTLVFTLVHLMYGEIMLRTRERFRLPGYIGLYFGEKAKRVMQIVTLVGLLGGMLAYILVGSTFLRILTGGVFGPVSSYHLIFWAVMSGIVALGLPAVKRMEGIMFVFMIAIIGIIFVSGTPHIAWDHFARIDPSEFFFPYGITMFALAGTAAIPAVRDILFRNERKMKAAIVAGTLIPAALYAIFIFTIFGISGPSTPEDALSGIGAALGASVEYAAMVFGIFAIATSYVVFGLYLRDTLWYDFNVPRKAALATAVFAPIALVLAYPGSYISVIGFLGAIIGGLELIFIIAAFMRARIRGDRDPEYAIALPNTVGYALIAVFAAGIGYTIYFR